MAKNLSTKYYQENEGRLKKKLVKNIKIVLKEKNKKGTIWSWYSDIDIDDFQWCLKTSLSTKEKCEIFDFQSLHVRFWGSNFEEQFFKNFVLKFIF